MKIETPGSRHKRQIILKGVYEDNLRIKDRKTAGPTRRTTPQAPPPRRTLWTARLALVFTSILIVVGGFQVYKELQAKQRGSEIGPTASSDPALSVSERFEQQFGSAIDPGLSRDGTEDLEREVPLANLFGLQVKTIVIDAGHGGRDPGASGPTGLPEKVITLDVAKRLQRRLEDHGYRILMTRDDDAKMTLRQRVTFANDNGADLFVSIHVNAIPVDTLTFVETFYFSPRGDAKARRLAELENEDSGYSMAEWRDAIENIGNTMKFQESKHLATSIQKMLYRNMHEVNDDVDDWGVRSGPFVVLLGVEAPAVLAEISVISNPKEEHKLYTPQYREQLAMSLEAGIVDYLNPSLSEGN